MVYMNIFGILKRKIRHRLECYLATKALFDTVKANQKDEDGAISLSMLELKYKFKHIKNINDKIKNDELLLDYDVWLNEDNDDYYLIKHNVCCFKGNIAYTNKDKEMGLDIISYDYEIYNLYIMAYTHICLDGKKTAKEFIKNNSAKITELMFNDCNIEVTNRGLAIYPKQKA